MNIQFFAEEEIKVEEETIEEQEEIKVEEQVEETSDPEIPVFKTKEEYNKLLQSTSSKAKNELLKEIGFSTVAEIRDAVSKSSNIDELTKELNLSKTEVEELKLKLNESNAAIKKAEDDRLLKSMSIAEEHADLFLKLVDSDNSELSREEKAKNVKITLAKMVGAEVKIGAERQLGTNVDDDVKKEMARLRKL